LCLNIIGLSLFAVHLLTADMACITHMHCIAGSSSSQISIEKRTRRRQSRQTAAGDAHDTAVAATSSVSRWQQFATSVQSALYFCLVTCPAGTFSLFACCIVNRYTVCWNVSGMLFVVFFTPPDRGAGYCGDHVSLCVCVCLSLCKHISETAHPTLSNFLHVTCGRGLVLLCQRCNALFICGFVADVMFAHNGHE